MDLAVNLADTTSRYLKSEFMGHPGPIEIVIIKKCPKLLRIYGSSSSSLIVMKPGHQMVLLERF